MITKFSTASLTPATGTSKGSNNTILYILIGGAILYLAYRYISKQQQQKAEEQK